MRTDVYIIYRFFSRSQSNIVAKADNAFMARLIWVSQSPATQGADPLDRSKFDNEDIYLFISSDLILSDSDVAIEAVFNQSRTSISYSRWRE